MNKEIPHLINEPQADTKMFSNKEMFDHPDLAFVAISGSASLKSNGKRSDIDITTVMTPENPEKIDVETIIKLGRQLNLVANRFKSQFENTHPIIISTIRLEEAQVSLGEIFTGKTVLPIHWLHYPSVDFAKNNEPPGLFEGLISGDTIKGDSNNILRIFKNTDANTNSHLGGLDWLTDSFKVLISNIGSDKHKSLLPESFLKNLATHNLEYFWKWKIIAPFIKAQNLIFRGWGDAEQNANIIPSELFENARSIQKMRHSGVEAPLEKIIRLHRRTFNLWPI